MLTRTKPPIYFAITFFLLLLTNNLFAQRSVTGNVTGNDNLPVVNASVVVKGTQTGVRTDENGNFTIVIPANKSVLVVSSVGFKQQEITVKGNTITPIKLVAENAVLSEVVVTGYSRQSKRDVTGAVSTISADVVSKTPVTDVGSVLQGVLQA